MSRPATPAEKLRQALELFEVGVRLMRQNLVRSHPEATPREIDEMLTRWLHERPGAEHGDCPGRVVELPRGR